MRFLLPNRCTLSNLKIPTPRKESSVLESLLSLFYYWSIDYETRSYHLLFYMFHVSCVICSGGGF